MILDRDMYYHQSSLMQDPVFWSFDGTTLTFELLKNTGRGELESDRHREWDAFKDRIRRVTIRDGITEIGDEFFRGCAGLKEVHLPKTLKKIGARAFKGCEALKQIRLPFACELGPGAFQDCRNLVDVQLSKNLRSIPETAFDGCCSLQAVVIPESVKGIQEFAFRGCTALTDLQLPGKADFIHPRAFDSLPDKYKLEGIRSLKSSGTLYYARVDPCEVFYLPGEIRRLAEFSLQKARAEILLIHDEVESVRPRAFSGIAVRVLYLGSGIHVLPKEMLFHVNQLQTLYIAGRLERVGENSIPEGIRIITVYENREALEKIDEKNMILFLQSVSEMRRYFYHQFEDELKTVLQAPAFPLNPCDLV